VQNPAVGVSGAEASRGQMNISKISYQDTTKLLASGTYTATQTIAGNPGETYSVNYTALTQPYSIVSNVTFNGLSWSSGTSIDNVGVDREQVVTFTHADSASTARYLLILQRNDGQDLNQFNADRLFIKTTGTSFSIPQGALDASVSYCARIQAKNSADGNLRSETAALCFNTVSGTNPGDGNVNPVVDFTGKWNFTETVNSADGVCAAEVNSSTTYVVDIAQNGSSITANYNGTTLNGSTNGSQITLNGSVPDSGGTTTFNLTGTLNNGCISATSNWSWSDGVDSCSNGSSTLTAALQSSPNACSTGNPGGGNPSNSPSSGGGGGGGALQWMWLLLLPVFIIRRIFYKRSNISEMPN
jgi:hypothetical protein